MANPGFPGDAPMKMKLADGPWEDLPAGTKLEAIAVPGLYGPVASQMIIRPVVAVFQKQTEPGQIHWLSKPLPGKLNQC